jgi:hypothetical protein
MAGLKEIVREEVRKYAGSGRGANLRLFPILDDEQGIYNVIGVPYPVRENVSGVMVFARVVGDKVIIEEDATNKPLLDALLQQGVRREQIVLAYQGESVPDPIEMF